MPAIACQPSIRNQPEIQAAFRQPGRAAAEPAEHQLLIDNVAYFRRRIRRGESLFNAGDACNAIYSVHHGFFKTCVVDGEGREQVSGFHMVGDIIGLDGLGSGRYDGRAVALEDSEVCVIPFPALEKVARDVPRLQRHLHTLLAREIVRDHGMMMLLGSLGAEEKVAAFLTGLSRRLVQRGYSPSEFNLRMSRADIGSYLGLKLETVSRVFGGLAEKGLIGVDQKHIRILDLPGLERVLAS